VAQSVVAVALSNYILIEPKIFLISLTSTGFTLSG
jgi:hypothetical protein